ncbi:MAG: hypothetical protein IPM07_19430 [Anaerolineales bacterium]|nr:hypothetical protein [Anaerolineales bacterium]
MRRDVGDLGFGGGLRLWVFGRALARARFAARLALARRTLLGFRGAVWFGRRRLG